MPFWRYRIRFSKRGTARFISHRDLIGVLARTFRRAELPVRMSQGFNPRPRFSLPAPLSLGIEGLDEVLELDLAENPPPEEVGQRLGRNLPAGIEVLQCELLDPGAKARVETVNYRIVGEPPPGSVERCAASEELLSVRQQGKHIDIRPYITSISRCDGGCECHVLVKNEGTARPAEIVDALAGGDAALARRFSLVRTKVNLTAPPLGKT